MPDSDALVAAIRDILWPDGDPDAEWRVDTIELVADVLIQAGLRPDDLEIPKVLARCGVVSLHGGHAIPRGFCAGNRDVIVAQLT